MKGLLKELNKKRQESLDALTDLLANNPLTGTLTDILDTTGQKVVDQFPPGTFQDGTSVSFSNETALPSMGTDAITPMQNIMSSAGIHNPAASMLTSPSASGTLPEHITIQDVQNDLLRAIPSSNQPILTTTEKNIQELQDRNAAVRRYQEEEEARKAKQAAEELKTTQQEIDRKQGLLELPEGSKRVEEMLLASGLLRDRDEDEVTQIGAAAPIYLS
tara:strand:- start:1226 stop:1879 length:654 start_codon:yes stop_codon:yes gene_type:complete